MKDTTLNPSPESPASQRFLTYKQAATRLAVSVVTMRRWVAQKKVRVCRYSTTCVRIPLEDVMRLEREALV